MSLAVAGNPAFDTRRVGVDVAPEARLFSRMVWAAEQLDRQGIAITVESVRSIVPDLSKVQVQELLATSKFEMAMASRGITVSSTGLSPQQLAAVAIYMDMTTPMTHRQKLRVIGITDQQWRGWMRNAAFATQITQLAEDATRAAAPVAAQRLAQQVDAGDLAAIKFWYEVTGTYNPRAQGVDVGQVLGIIYGVLDEFCSPEQLGLITARLRKVMGDTSSAVPELQATASFADASSEGGA